MLPFIICSSIDQDSLLSNTIEWSRCCARFGVLYRYPEISNHLAARDNKKVQLLQNESRHLIVFGQLSLSLIYQMQVLQIYIHILSPTRAMFRVKVLHCQCHTQLHMGSYVSLPKPKTKMSWDTDSSSSGLSTPRSLSPSPFSTPLTPVDPVGGFGKTIPKNILGFV